MADRREWWEYLLEGGSGAGAGFLATGNPLGAVVGGILGLLGTGDKGASRDAMKSQLQMQKMMHDLYKRQADIDMPYRKGLFDALAQRQKANFPRFLPRKPTSFNPMAMRNKLRAPTSRDALQNAPSMSLFSAIQNARQKGRNQGLKGGRFAQPQGPSFNPDYS